MDRVVGTLLIMLCATHATAGAGSRPMAGPNGNQQVAITGVVEHENRDTLPLGCDAISGDQFFTIHAGRKYANGTPGMIYGMSEHDVHVEACARVTVTFVNDDEIRHQWMVHGLPKYLYPAGMFYIGAMGGKRQTGTFIVPGEDKSYLIHCDIAQHMEKGMRGQLIVGKGSGNLWGVRGVSDYFLRAPYLPPAAPFLIMTAIIVSFLLTRVLLACIIHEHFS